MMALVQIKQRGWNLLGPVDSFSNGNLYPHVSWGDLLTVNVAAPVISVSPSSLNFGGVNVGGSLDRTITVRNVGGGVLNGNATTNTPFAIVSGGSYSLSAGQSQTVTVRFSPTSAETFLGNVNLTGGGDASLAVSGAGVIPPNLALSFNGKLRDRVGQRGQDCSVRMDR